MKVNIEQMSVGMLRTIPWHQDGNINFQCSTIWWWQTKPLKSSRPNATATTIIERLHSSSAMVFRYMDISQFNQQKRIYTNNALGFTQFARIYFRVAWHVRFRFWPWACTWWKCTVFSMKLCAFVIVYRAVAPMQSKWGKTHTETYRRNK